MSEFSEAVLGAVTDDWQTTTEIIEKIPPVHVQKAGYGNHVRHHLRKWERYGKIERRWPEDGRRTGIPCEWRRVG